MSLFDRAYKAIYKGWFVKYILLRLRFVTRTFFKIKSNCVGEKLLTFPVYLKEDILIAEYSNDFISTAWKIILNLINISE